MNILKVILVDDNEIFRRAIKNLLIKEYNVEIIGEASNADEFLALNNYHMASIILMDIMMPGTDGITLAKRVLWERPDLKIIAITMHVDKVYLKALIEAGFKGCIFKTNLYSEIINAIDSVHKGQLYFPSNIILSN
jgi:two-component system invasion response regulator UvrY